MSQVYLIHFDQPYKHASHYVGYCDNLKARCYHHHNGTGARLMQVVTDAGIHWNVVRTWNNADRNFERRLKRWHNTRKLCPICNPEHWQNNMNTEDINP